MTNSEIKEIALRQSAEDNGCHARDFLSDKNVIVPFRLGENARKYYKEPITCNFVSYGSNIVAATTEEVTDLVTEHIGKFELYHCFETPNIYWLNDRLKERGHTMTGSWLGLPPALPIVTKCGKKRFHSRMGRNDRQTGKCC